MSWYASRPYASQFFMYLKSLLKFDSTNAFARHGHQEGNCVEPRHSRFISYRTLFIIRVQQYPPMSGGRLRPAQKSTAIVGVPRRESNVQHLTPYPSPSTLPRLFFFLPLLLCPLRLGVLFWLGHGGGRCHGNPAHGIFRRVLPQ